MQGVLEHCVRYTKHRRPHTGRRCQPSPNPPDSPNILLTNIGSHLLYQVDPPGVGTRGAVPRVVLGLVLCGELAVAPGRHAPHVEHPRALVAAGDVAGLAANAVSRVAIEPSEVGKEWGTRSAGRRGNGCWCLSLLVADEARTTRMRCTVACERTNHNASKGGEGREGSTTGENPSNKGNMDVQCGGST